MNEINITHLSEIEIVNISMLLNMQNLNNKEAIGYLTDLQGKDDKSKIKYLFDDSNSFIKTVYIHTKIKNKSLIYCLINKTFVYMNIINFSVITENIGCRLN